MVEALASGVPVAAYPVPGPLDVVTTPKVGALNEDLRAACLAAIGCDPADCRAHAETFTWAQCAPAVPRHAAPDPAQRLAAPQAPRGAERRLLIKAAVFWTSNHAAAAASSFAAESSAPDECGRSAEMTAIGRVGLRPGAELSPNVPLFATGIRLDTQARGFAARR